MTSKKMTIYLNTKLVSLLKGFSESTNMSTSEAGSYLIGRGLENVESVDMVLLEMQTQQKQFKQQFNRLAGLIIQVFKQSVKGSSLSKAAAIRLNALSISEAEQLEAQALKKAFESLKSSRNDDEIA